MEDNLKRLMKQLGTAINDSLSQSESISEAIDEIKGAGYDVFLVLEATIGFNKREGEEEEDEARDYVPGSLELTPQDTQFLKSLRISLGGSNERPPV